MFDDDFGNLLLPPDDDLGGPDPSQGNFNNQNYLNTLPQQLPPVHIPQHPQTHLSQQQLRQPRYGNNESLDAPTPQSGQSLSFDRNMEMMNPNSGAEQMPYYPSQQQAAAMYGQTNAQEMFSESPNPSEYDPGAPPTKKRSARSVSDDNSVAEGGDKKAKRRAAVAAASRATRAKRKKELEELKHKNKRLEREREAYLNTITDLQMKVQALRETGAIDLRMENDLLRAELGEHKRFLSHFKNVADGLPTNKSAKRVMLLQGADTAVAQVLGLLATSMVDPTWRHGVMDRHGLRMRYQRLPHGSSCATSKRVTFRVDSQLLPISQKSLAESVWKRYVSNDSRVRFSRCFNANTSVNCREIDVGFGDEFSPRDGFRSSTANPTATGTAASTTVSTKTELSLDAIKPAEIVEDHQKDRGRIKVFYYRETRPDIPKLRPMNPAGGNGAEYFDRIMQPAQEMVTQAEGSVLDLIVVLTGRHTKVSNSSFPAQSVFDVRNAHNQMQNPNSQETILRNRPIECDYSSSGGVEAIVIAMTSTQHTLDLEPVSQSMDHNKDKPQRPALLEGVVIRPEENGGPGCYFTGMYSFPVHSPGEAPNFASTTEGIIRDDGTFAEAWKDVVKEYIGVLEESLPGVSRADIPGMFNVGEL